MSIRLVRNKRIQEVSEKKLCSCVGTQNGNDKSMLIQIAHIKYSHDVEHNRNSFLEGICYRGNIYLQLSTRTTKQILTLKNNVLNDLLFILVFYF